MNNSKKTLLEIYAPKTFDELKLPKRVLDLILENNNKIGFRLLLSGTPGTGKSTTSKLMVKGHDVMMLSGSNDFNVETLRQKVVPFVSSHSVLGNRKTLIIEECENISDKVQDSFKMILDGAKKINFIFLTNEPEKVNSAIKSRCTPIEYDFQLSEIEEQKVNYVNFIVNVCKSENIEYDGKGLGELYKINFPDFRHILVVLQQFKDTNTSVSLANVKLISESGKQNLELYDAIESLNDAQKFYEKITEFKGKERECLISLGEPFFVYLNSKGKWEHTLKSAKIVADYSNRFVTTINKFGTFFACCVELKNLFK